jgi:3-hydroxyisobutyrate dehydrogenase-like beta-hydroxyacid dehydrogenase
MNEIAQSLYHSHLPSSPAIATIKVIFHRTDRLVVSDRIAIAFIGFGEVGHRFAADLLAGGKASIAAYDLLFDDPGGDAERMARCKALGVTPARSAAEAAHGAAIVISAVTADAVETVAEAARDYLQPLQIFLDVNSAAPATKQRAARHVEAAGAHYVEGAMMGPVAAPGIRVETLAGGPAAERAAALLNGLGFNLTPVAVEHGKASAMKLCRSIMIKGMEALIIDCATAARAAGVEREVFASLAATFPSIDWPKLADHMAGRVARHGRRRAAEMREAAEMLGDMGLDASLALAVAEAQARGVRS